MCLVMSPFLSKIYKVLHYINFSRLPQELCILNVSSKQPNTHIQMKIVGIPQTQHGLAVFLLNIFATSQTSFSLVLIYTDFISILYIYILYMLMRAASHAKQLLPTKH